MTQLGDVTKYLSFDGVILVADLYITDKTLLQEYGSISVSITSDQNLSFAIQFSNDSLTWYSSTQESIIAGISEVITAVVIGKWCRYEILNAGLDEASVVFSTYASTNPLALQTQVQREGNTFPTFNIGNFASSLYGDLRTVDHVSLLDHKFIYSSIVGGNLVGPDTLLTNYDSGGLDTLTVLEIDTNMLSTKNIAASNLGEFLTVASTLPVVYQSGRTVEMTFSFKINLTGYVDYQTEGIDSMVVGYGNSGFFGSNIIDGVFLGYPLAPAGPYPVVNELSLIYYNGGVETYIPISRWQEDRLDGTGPSGITLDIENLSVWRFRSSYHGATSITLEYHFPYINQWQECHRIILENNITTPNFQNPSFSYIQRAERTTTSTFDPMIGDVAILCSGVSISIEEILRGLLVTYSYSMPAPVSTLIGEEGILSLQINQNINGKYNGSVTNIRKLCVSAYNATGTESIVNVYEGGTFMGETFTPINTVTTPVDILTAGTYNIGSGYKRSSTIIYPGSGVVIDLNDQNLIMGAGDTLTIALQSFTANSRVLVTVEYVQII